MSLCTDTKRSDQLLLLKFSKAVICMSLKKVISEDS